MVNGKSSVSYTHLDVYKRQAPRCPEVNQHHFLLLQGFGEGMGNAVNVRKGKIGHGRVFRADKGDAVVQRLLPGILRRVQLRAAAARLLVDVYKRQSRC